MDCQACTEARTSRWCGAYRADCLECAARALSHSPAFWASAKAGAMTQEYRAALFTVFAEKLPDGHRMVKAWADTRAKQLKKG
jgi:hypothetical protein